MTGIGGRQASDMLTDALLAARDSRLLNSSGAATIGSSMSLLALAVVELLKGTAEVEVVEGIVEVSAAACIALNLIILNNLVIYPEP